MTNQFIYRTIPSLKINRLGQTAKWKVEYYDVHELPKLYTVCYFYRRLNYSIPTWLFAYYVGFRGFQTGSSSGQRTLIQLSVNPIITIICPHKLNVRYFLSCNFSDHTPRVTSIASVDGRRLTVGWKLKLFDFDSSGTLCVTYRL